MGTLHPQYVVDERGIPHSVVLEIGEFRSLLHSAGVQMQELPQAGFLRLSDLGWSSAEALDTRIRLRSFEDDWEAPGMDVYDNI
jgi:hypothetical protein